MNLKTLYELKEVLDFCGYHDTIVEDMTNRGIDLESLEDKVNHEQKEIEENVYPNLHGTELLNKENISLLGEEILQYFEKTLEEWDKGIIDYDKNTNQLFHNEGKIFSSDVIAWYEGGRTTEDLSYTDMDELSEEEKEIVKEFLDSYKGNYNLIEFDCNGQCSTIWIRDNLTDSELEACQIIDKHFDVFKNLEDRVDIELFGIRKEEISTEMNEIEEDLDEIEM